MSETTKPRYTLDFEGRANGRIGPTSISALGPDGETLYTEEANLTKAGQREKVAKRLAEKLNDDPKEVLDRIEEYVNKTTTEHKRLKKAATVAPDDDDPDAEERRRLDKTPADIREEAEALLHDPDLIDRVTRDIALMGVAGEQDLAATLYLVGTSRKLCKPLAARVRGPSTSGKSYLIEKSSSLMPPESVITATQISPQALFYMKKGSLRHKLVVAGERSRNQEDEAADATRALREMLTAGRLSKLLAVKMGDRMETQLVEQEGPISYLESTTLGEVFAEDENRCLPLETDERPEQTSRILTAMAAGFAGQLPERDPARVRQVHQAAQRMLERREVVIPFASQVGAKLPPVRVEVRRAFPFLMSMIGASALLHQFQREQTDDGRVVAERADYEVAALLLSGAMRRLLGAGISAPSRRFGERLREWFPAPGTFTAPQAKKREGSDGSSRRSVYVWLEELVDASVVEMVTEQVGRTAATYKLTGLDPGTATAYTLPAADEVFAGVAR